MKQSLQLRIGQHLTMTPQLQQAIKLLQLSTLELRAEIQQALESNPMLELAEEAEGEAPLEGAEEPGIQAEQDVAAAGDGDASLEEPEPGQMEIAGKELEDQGDGAFDMEAVPDELPVDSAWEDIYDSSMPSAPPDRAEDRREIDNPDNSTETLREHLLWQMRLTVFTEQDQVIAMAIIDAVNDKGFLSTPLEEIHAGLREELDIDLDEVEAVLHQIQNFDPVGVAARDLRECMLIQLAHYDPETPWLEQARTLVRDHLGLLGGRDYAQLMKRMKCSQDELKQIVELIQTLNPRPGNLIADRKTEYIVPDVTVRKDKGVWKVELNAEAIPRIRVNAGYAGLVKRADNSSDNVYLRNHLQEARWFIKSLQSRNETLLKVATCIVERQRDFLEQGEEAMKPLVLHDVAEAVGMHESTISRVTTEKYMHTPRGIFELKYFFSSHVSTASGGECSATAIRALIKKLVAAEDPRKPLSDSKIAQVLEQQGINVARRTIAKYRESLVIPSSSERKRLV